MAWYNRENPGVQKVLILKFMTYIQSLWWQDIFSNLGQIIPRLY